MQVPKRENNTATHVRYKHEGELTVAAERSRTRGWRPGGADRRSDALLLRATRGAAGAGVTLIVVRPVEVQSVILQQHHVLCREIVELFELGGGRCGVFRFELGHGEVEGLIRLVRGQQDVRGLLQEHRHFLFLSAPKGLRDEIDGVVIVVVLERLGGAGVDVVVLGGGRWVRLNPPPDGVAF